MRGRLKKELGSFQPHIVATSSVSQNFGHAKEHARVAKEHGLPVIVRGIHISCVPQSLSEDMDIGCIGEGEETFSELMSAYLARNAFCPEDLRDIPGLIYRDGGKLVRTPDRLPSDSLDKLPHPKRALGGYQTHDYMFTTRGCPYRCAFCSSSRYWRKVRSATPEYVIEEVNELVANGVKTISFYDDLFIADKKRLARIADLIIENGLHKRVSLTCSCRANVLNKDIVEVLKSMNVVAVALGLESGSDRILKYLKGTSVSVEDNRNAVEILKDAGIQANASFVIGSPDETEDEIMETYDFIKKSRLDFVDIYVLTPYPGTPVWDQAVERGLVHDQMDWSRLNVNFEVNWKSAVIMSETLTREQLVSIYRRFRRMRFFRMLRALPRSAWLKDLPRIGSCIVKERLLRMVRAG